MKVSPSECAFCHKEDEWHRFGPGALIVQSCTGANCDREVCGNCAECDASYEGESESGSHWDVSWVCPECRGQTSKQDRLEPSCGHIGAEYTCGECHSLVCAQCELADATHTSDSQDCCNYCWSAKARDA